MIYVCTYADTITIMEVQSTSENSVHTERLIKFITYFHLFVAEIFPVLTFCNSRHDYCLKLCNLRNYNALSLIKRNEVKLSNLGDCQDTSALYWVITIANRFCTRTLLGMTLFRSSGSLFWSPNKHAIKHLTALLEPLHI